MSPALPDGHGNGFHRQDAEPRAERLAERSATSVVDVSDTADVTKPGSADGFASPCGLAPWR